MYRRRGTQECVRHIADYSFRLKSRNKSSFYSSNGPSSNREIRRGNMMRAFLCVAFLSGAAFGQPTDRFEAAEVHASPHSDNNFNLFMRGPQTRAGRYEIKTATMVDLIRDRKSTRLNS